MKKFYISLVFWGIMFSCIIVNAQVDLPISNATIKAGTMIPLELTDNLASKNTFVGEIIVITVLEDIIVDNVVVIESGSQGYVKVIAVNKSGSWGKAGSIVVEPQYVSTVNGKVVPLNGTVESDGSSHDVIKGGISTGIGDGMGNLGNAGNYNNMGWSWGTFAVLLAFTDASPGGDTIITAGTKIMATVSRTVDLGVEPENLYDAICTDVKRKNQTNDGKFKQLNYSGEYSTMKGRVTLVQEQNSSIVFGYYDHSNGSIEGQVVGGRLLGRWIENQNDYTKETGYCEFVLTTDGRQVFIVWRNHDSANWQKDTFANVLHNY